jgi:hypothetical protein
LLGRLPNVGIFPTLAGDHRHPSSFSVCVKLNAKNFGRQEEAQDST